MNAVPSPSQRGTELLLAHLASLDPERPPARERLEDALGPELARKLVYALSSGAPERREGDLRARFVFAA
jgi:hypothetical protein